MLLLFTVIYQETKTVMYATHADAQTQSYSFSDNQAFLPGLERLLFWVPNLNSQYPT